MKMVNIKTVIKPILFIVLLLAVIIYLFTGKESKEIVGPPKVPEPTVTEGSNEEEGSSEGVTQPEVAAPEQLGKDDKTPENRAGFYDVTQQEIDGHRFVVANDQQEMYMKEENLSIIMRDKNTGAVMYSTVDKPVKSNEEWTNFMRSSIVLEYLVGTNIVVYRADMYSGNPEKKITYTTDGFVANIYYPELEISYEVQVLLTDEGFKVEIPQDKITEDNSKYKVAGVYVYPFLGYSKLDDREGYMFIPDGSGALIRLKDNDGKFKQPYSEMVYGSNVGIDDSYVLSLFNQMNPFNKPERILAPVFGMVQTDLAMGYLGIIEEGQFSAKVEAYPSGAIIPYNWITAKFIYRQVYNQPTSKDSGTMVVRQKNMNNFDIKVRYDFVSEDKADYVGLAGKYRTYLLSNKLITEKGNEFKVRVDLLGSDIEKGLVFNKDIPMTTFEQASEIFNGLQDNGVKDILSIYKGWQDNGYYASLPVRSFKTESKLSDEMTIQDLMQETKDKSIDLYLGHDALRINGEEQGNTKYKVMKKYNKQAYNENVYGKVYNSFGYLNPQSSADIMEKMKKEYKDNDVDNIMISGISNELFSYSEGSKEFDRIKTKEYYESIVADYSDNFNILLEQPFSYLWDYTNKVVDLPMKSSNYVFTDEEIPFLALTLRGIVPLYSEYTNFQANQKEFFLQLVEQGLNPSFYITHEDPSELLNTNSSHIYSSKYDRYDEMIQAYYQELKEVYEQTEGSIIQDYSRLNGVTKVTYGNGTIIYVNYQQQDVQFDGLTIKGLSYKVVQDH
ncbi:hypothetical protein FQ087_04755 [Sporosarcina sp. ANT_H38]|nr:hypothetical protein FQ087_04755 [Sporosarcina sp. ANT_H38]